MTQEGSELRVNPRDGLRRLLQVVVPNMYLPFPENIHRFQLELERDNFLADGWIGMDKALDKIVFTIENRTANAHTTGLLLSFPDQSSYGLFQDGKPVPLVQTGKWNYPWRAQLAISGPASQIELVNTDRRPWP